MTAKPNESLGEYLKRERERLGITLEQVASATKVNTRILVLIESDDYRELPAKPFVRGFVISYARFIGLDPKEVLTRFNEFLEVKSHDRPTHDAGHSGYAFEKREGDDNSRKILWVVLGGFALLAVLAIVIFKPKHSRHRENPHADRLRTLFVTPTPAASTAHAEGDAGKPTPAASAITASPTSGASHAHAPTPTPKPLLTPTPAPSFAPTPQPTATEVKADPLNSGADLDKDQIVYKAVFTAQKDLWIRYRVDQKPLTRIILRKDRILYLRAREIIRAEISDSTAAIVRLNGKTVYQVASEPGEGSSREVHPQGFVFPKEKSSEVGAPFANEKPLPRDVPPSPSASKPTPTPAL